MPSRGFCLASSRALCLSWSHEWTLSAREEAACGDSHSCSISLTAAFPARIQPGPKQQMAGESPGRELWLPQGPCTGPHSGGGDGVGVWRPRTSPKPLHCQGSLAFTRSWRSSFQQGHKPAGGCKAAPYLNSSLPWGGEFLTVFRVVPAEAPLPALGEAEVQKPNP